MFHHHKPSPRLLPTCLTQPGHYLKIMCRLLLNLHLNLVLVFNQQLNNHKLSLPLTIKIIEVEVAPPKIVVVDVVVSPVIELTPDNLIGHQIRIQCMGHAIVAGSVTFHPIALIGIQLPCEPCNNPLLIMLIIVLKHHHGYSTPALTTM